MDQKVAFRSEAWPEGLTERLSEGGPKAGPAVEVATRACSNLALVKYWGKRDEHLNLPAVGSISVTLAGLFSEARVSRATGREDDVLVNGQAPPPEARAKLVRFLDLVRSSIRDTDRLRVHVSTNFPVAAGLASSASTFAALAVALDVLFGLGLEATQLSALARRGSGSAARSVFGGFVEWLAGRAADGSDSVARQIAGPEHWPLAVVVVITRQAPKKWSSSVGMRLTENSPFFPAWIASQANDLQAARRAIAERDLAALGAVAEHSAFKMHALMMAAQPAVLYWEPATVAVLQCVQALREAGVPAFASIDAGPQVKILCSQEDREQVVRAVKQIPELQVLCSQPGPGPEILEVKQ